MLRFLLSSGLAIVLASTAAAATWPGAAPCDVTLPSWIFADGFESGDLLRWSLALP